MFHIKKTIVHKTIPWQPIVVVSIITLLGALIRLTTLADKSLWFDEAAVYWISQEPTFIEIIRKNAAENSAPPLFALITAAISRISDSEWMLRFPAALVSILSIPALYVLIRQFLLPRNIAYIGILLFTIAPTQIMYAQQVREYSCAVFITIMICIFFIKYYVQPQFLTWLGMTTVMSVGIGLQYGIGLLVLSLNMVILIGLIRKQLKQKAIIGWVLAQALILIIVYVVYELALKYQLETGGFASTRYLSHAYWDGTLQSFAHLFMKETYAILQFTYPLELISIVILYIGGFSAWRNYYGQMAILLTIIPLAVTFCAALVGLYPYHGGRQDIMLTVMPFVLISFAFDLLYRHISSLQIYFTFLILFVISIMVGLYSSFIYLEQSGPEHLRPVIQTYIQEKNQADQTYVYYGSHPAFRYYTRDTNPENVTFGSKNRDNPTMYIQEIETVLKKGERSWLIMSYCYPDECTFIPANLTKDYTVRIVDQENDAYLYKVE